ncbi:succinate dehydrogenase, hydrophobic membrane anchor protein [Pleionea sp. CnH1-48]|uniref:succinate dehydrogenase, hydrophobic membrane anchor protein n=1 Tax=Pleionea sp. CnH1-48 TaxID=2954494 RepID=UPI00209821C7|nr:succinate dehydrogenase, hydrophobic membrane anchor protein [Pleionea sp. CnH1-48]MCO7223450.1 succinate dehydrogenase, hydrophobic membrane anchor protein [Pleionea sp. CnH1-48]
MVTAVTSLGRSGLHDWFVQRLSAVVMALYTFFLLWFVATTPNLGYEQWVALFHNPVFKIASILVVILMAFHIWIGLWIISTDYIKPVAIRMVAQAFTILVCLSFIFWGIQILWSV